jgi:3-oxo-5-alpha-steroid 4-dehydrogenase 1
MDDITLYWILLAAIFAFAVMAFFTLQVISAPYGRHIRRGWGYTLKARTGWLVMEFPAFLVIILMFLAGDRKDNIVSIVFLAMWGSHYFHRTFIFPFLMKGGDKKFPAVLVVFAIIFNALNGYVNGKYLFQLAPSYDISWLYDPRFLAGAALFFSGMIINLHSDHVLRILRKNQEDGYRIPRRGLFRYISSPNYSGEILEWTGWAVATWSLPGLAFAVFTFANLAPRAFSNHRWYQEKFPDYPKQRKALIPFIR